MGLDFSHCSAMWTYSAFHEFRGRLITEAGCSWDARKGDDPLFVLLEHSDCEGYIETEDCAPLAHRLHDIVRLWPEDDRDRYEGLQLVRGLRLAAARGERLEFC